MIVNSPHKMDFHPRLIENATCRYFLSINDRQDEISIEMLKLSMTFLFTGEYFRNFISKCDSFDLNLWCNFRHQTAISETTLKDISIRTFGVFCMRSKSERLNIDELMLLAINNLCVIVAHKLHTNPYKVHHKLLVLVCLRHYSHLLYTRAKYRDLRQIT